MCNIAIKIEFKYGKCGQNYFLIAAQSNRSLCFFMETTHTLQLTSFKAFQEPTKQETTNQEPSQAYLETETSQSLPGDIPQEQWQGGCTHIARS